MTRRPTTRSSSPRRGTEHAACATSPIRRPSSGRCSAPIGVGSIEDLLVAHPGEGAAVPPAQRARGDGGDRPRPPPPGPRRRGTPTPTTTPASSARAPTTTRAEPDQSPDLARRVLHRLHALPARGEPGHAPVHLRVPDHDRRAHRDGRRQRVALRRRLVAGRGRADGACGHGAGRRSSSRGASTRSIARSSRRTCEGPGLRLKSAPLADGVTDLDAAPARPSTDQTAAVVVQYPNFFGCLEDVKAAAEIAHAAGRPPDRRRRPGEPRAARAARRPRRRPRRGRGAGARRADELRRARTWASSPPSRSWCGACPAGSSAPPSTSTASAASCSRSRPASSTSAARRRPPTSAPTWPSARSWRRSTCPSWASAASARSASCRRPRRTTPPRRSRRSRACGSASRRRSSRSSRSQLPKSPERVVKRLLKDKILAGLPLKAFDRQYKDCLLVAVTEKRTREEIDAYAAALAARSPEAAMPRRPRRLRQADLRAVLPGPPRLLAARVRRARDRSRARSCRAAHLRADARRAARGVGGRRRPPLLAAEPDELRRGHALLPARLLHDEVQPEDQRGHGAAARLRPAAPAHARGRRARGRSSSCTSSRATSRRSRAWTRSRSSPRRARRASSPACS